MNGVIVGQEVFDFIAGFANHWLDYDNMSLFWEIQD